MEKVRDMTVTTKLAKTVRVLTVAPLQAFCMLTVLHAALPSVVGLGAYLFALFFLALLPLMAYPLQPFLPRFRSRGREGQRSLAIVMAVLGYVGGCAYALLAGAPRAILLIYLTYLLSGVGIVLLNHMIKLGASGHACGVAGPIFLGAALLGRQWGALLWCAYGVLLLLLVCWASLHMKRHSLRQLCAGALIPLVSLSLGIFLLGGAV